MPADARAQGLTPIAWFDSPTPLRSGWAWGQAQLQGGVAIAEAKVGQGRLVLFGPEITFRAQPHGTFKFLFNGIYLPPAQDEAGQPEAALRGQATRVPHAHAAATVLLLVAGLLSVLTVAAAGPAAGVLAVAGRCRACVCRAIPVRTTMREAFLAHLHPQSVMFNPGPVNGIELYTGRPARPVQLAWAPEVVDVAASGDFGYSTGPHQFRRTPEGEVLRQGYFCSVWVRSASEPWKVLIDLGTSQPTPVSLDVMPRDPTPDGRDVGRCEALRRRSQRPSASSRRRAKGDQVATYRALLARHARVYRDGGAPTEAVLPALDVIARRGKLARVTPEKTDVASSGDLGYAYGRLELADAARGRAAGLLRARLAARHAGLASRARRRHMGRRSQ